MPSDMFPTAGNLLAWLLTYALHSTLLLGSAWLFCRWRRQAAAWRDLACRIALVAGLVTSTLASGMGGESFGGRLAVPGLLPAESPIISTATASPALPAAPSATHAAAPILAPAALASTASPAASPAVSPVLPNPVLPRLPILLVSLWGIGVGLGLIRLGRGWLALRRALGDRVNVTDPALLALQADLAAAAGLRRAPRLTASAAIAGPMAIGLREICLPARAARELTPSQMRGLLAHETAHLGRGDLLWLRAFGLLDVVLFFQPLQGVIRSRFRAAAEELCDDWAAARSGGGVALAQCLERVATWVAGSGPAPVGVAALAESGSALVRRVERLLGMGGAGRPPRFAAGLLLLLPPLAVLFLVPAVIAEVSRASRTNKSWSWSDGDRSISIAARGDIEFSDDGLEILSISPDGSLRIDDRDAEGRTVLEVRPGADGRPDVEWTIDGERRPFGQEGRAWLAALMQRIEDDRENGHREARRAHAEAERVARQAQAQVEREMERAHREMERAHREAERELRLALEQREAADRLTEQEIREATQLAYENAVRAAQEADEQVARSGEQAHVDRLRRQVERLTAQVERLEAELQRRSEAGHLAPTPRPEATRQAPGTPTTPRTPRTPRSSATPRPGSPSPQAIPSPESPDRWAPPAPPAPPLPPVPPMPPMPPEPPLPPEPPDEDPHAPDSNPPPPRPRR